MAFRFAAVPGFGQESDNYTDSDYEDTTLENDSWQKFGAPVEAAGEQAQIAMTKGQARNIINRIGQEALRGSMTPNAFQSALFTVSQFANSPDMTRRTIRNTLATPGSQLLLSNPGLAKNFANQMLDKNESLIRSSGVNPSSLDKYVGPTFDILQQLKRDNLIRSNVSLNEIREEVQKPLYGALQDWTRANMNNSQLQKVLSKSGVGSNKQWGPRGFVPIAAGFQPGDFGVQMTPEARKFAQEAAKQEAWERSPAGRKKAEEDRKAREKMRTMLQYVERLKRN